MKRNLVYHSIFVHVFRWLSHLILFIARYKLVGELPKERRVVAIAAPHTSNWDFPVFITLVFLYRMEVRFLGKHTLFKGPMGYLMRWLGGMPVNRGTKDASAVVSTAVKLFDEDDMVLGIAPEGTRSNVGKWKTGFYRIAVAADVPILLAYIDSKTRTVGLSHVFYPTGDMEADINKIKAFYADKTGIKPLNKGF